MKAKNKTSGRRLGWGDLFVSGAIVDMTVNLWRAQIGIEAKDLAIENSEEVAKALSLGRYRLAPAKAFEEIKEAARSARRSWDYHSLNFGLIPGARYVPDSTMPKLLGELRAHKERFDDAVGRFMKGYEAMKAEQLPVLEKAIRDASRSPEAAEEAIRRLEYEYPTPESVRAKFNLRWSIYAIQGARSKAAAEAADDETETIKDVVRGMVTQLRDDMTEKLGAILAIVNRGGVLQEQSIRSATEVLDRVDALNVLGDEVLAEQSLRLRKLLDTVEPGKRIGDAVLGNLEGVRTALDRSLRDAVKEAERNLMGVGQRKFNLTTEKE